MVVSKAPRGASQTSWLLPLKEREVLGKKKGKGANHDLTKRRDKGYEGGTDGNTQPDQDQG